MIHDSFSSLAIADEEEEKEKPTSQEASVGDRCQMRVLEESCPNATAWLFPSYNVHGRNRMSPNSFRAMILWHLGYQFRSLFKQKCHLHKRTFSAKCKQPLNIW